MAEPVKTLAGAKRSFSKLVVLVGGAGAFLAAYYGTLTLQLPMDGRRAFLLLAAVAAAASTAGVVFRISLLLSTVHKLGDGAVAVDQQHLRRAVRETSSAPDRLFWAGLQHWLGASLFVAIGMAILVPSVPWTLPLRIALLGLLFGPLTALAGYFVVSLRSRGIIRALCDLGLSPSDVIAAVPPTRAQLRIRLVVFIAVVVIIPAALTADLSSSFARQGFARVTQVKDRGEQQLVASEVRKDALRNLLAMAGLLFVLSVATAYLAGTALGEPMREIAEEAARIAEGDLSRSRTIPAEDEIWAVSAAFTGMRTHLTQVLTQLKRAGIQIGATTEQIVATSTRYESGAADQATALNETSATTEELARSARQIAENAGSVSEIAQKTLAAAQAGQESADAFSTSMGRMRQDNQAIANAVVKLSTRVQQIGKIVEFINGVADKSDLLALSAELEGTKAGEVGRGFSLVAAEMRRLAENVIESTKEIEGLIEEIREATSAAVAATEAGVKATDSGGSLAHQVSESLKEIVQLAGQTSDAVRAISLATQQQQTGTDQLAEAMADILRVTQQSLAATKQVTSANVDLSVLAKDLKSAVGRFQIEEG